MKFLKIFGIVILVFVCFWAYSVFFPKILVEDFNKTLRQDMGPVEILSVPVAKREITYSKKIFVTDRPVDSDDLRERFPESYIQVTKGGESTRIWTNRPEAVIAYFQAGE